VDWGVRLEPSGIQGIGSYSTCPRSEHCQKIYCNGECLLADCRAVQHKCDFKMSHMPYSAPRDHLMRPHGM
jgi:hypothetical protein